MHYLDYAATAPTPPEVAETVARVMTEEFGNPSSQYTPGRRAKVLVDRSRKTVAAALSCDPGQLLFTSGGTEGDNWAIRAALWQNRRVGAHVITTAVEHAAVLQCLKVLEERGQCTVTYLKPDRQGHITATQVENALREDTALVSMMLVNNETGVRYPVEEVTALLRGRPTLLHVDAVQGFLEIPFTCKSLGADYVVLSGHKIGAPKGIGALFYGGKAKKPAPLIYGGGQEDGLRSGTEPTAQIAGFAKAVELRSVALEELTARLSRLRAYATDRLSALDGLEFVGDGGVPHILAFSLPGYPSQNIISELDNMGVYISAGSACHKGRASHVLTAMGLPPRTAVGTVRASFGPATTEADIDALCVALRVHKSRRFPMR